MSRVGRDDGHVVAGWWSWSGFFLGHRAEQSRAVAMAMGCRGKRSTIGRAGLQDRGAFGQKRETHLKRNMTKRFRDLKFSL